MLRAKRLSWDTRRRRISLQLQAPTRPPFRDRRLKRVRRTRWTRIRDETERGRDKVLASSYLGGGYLTQANAVAVDAAGNVSLTGLTVGLALGATPGAFQPKPADRCEPTINIGPGPPPYGTTDAFVLKLDPTFSTAKYLTYLGGACNDSGTGISLDTAGNAWIVGTTDSQDFPTKAPFQGQGIGAGFVSELSADGSQLLFSSWTDGVSLALDASGAAYLAGATTGVTTVPKVVPGNGFHWRR